MTSISMKPGWNEILPQEMSDTELLGCLTEADRRGLSAAHPEVERAYEALLEGRAGLAGELLSRALFPDGADTIRGRIEAHRKQAISRGKS